MISSRGQKPRLSRVAIVFQVLFLCLIAFNLAPRIANPLNVRLSHVDIRLVAPTDAIPRVALNRISKSFPGEIGANLLGAKGFQSIQLVSVAVAPIQRVPIPGICLLAGSLLIRAPPSISIV